MQEVYYSTTGSGEIIHEEWNVKKKLNGKVELLISELDSACKFLFKGNIWVEERHIYAHVQGIKHTENMFFIFPEPVARELGRTVGIGSALTMKKEPWSGEQLLSKQRLDSNRVKELLGREKRIVTKFT